MSCECESGLFGCECCCASVTNLKGGLHPDSIRSTYADLTLTSALGAVTRTFENKLLLKRPAHIVSVTASLVAVRRDTDLADDDRQLKEPTSSGEANIARTTPVSFSLFTIPGYNRTDLTKGGWNAPDDSENGRNYIVTGSVSSTSPSWQSPEDLFGYFADGGLFVEFNAPTTNYGIRVVVNYVDRLQFSPAYHDPIKVMQHYWKCSRKDAEFLEGFYGGTELLITSLNSSGTASASSLVSSDEPTNPFSSIFPSTLSSWHTIP
jgi:hypothetical protein